MSRDIIKVSCHLATPIAGDPPMLDALIEFEMAQRQGKAEKIQRSEPAPVYGEIHIPMLRQQIGGLLVPCCSSPIMVSQRQTTEHFGKRLSVEHSNLLSPRQRKKVAMGNATYKAYHLPLRLHRVDRIVWFARATRRHTLKLLKSVHSIGKKRSQGYGRVDRWEAERIEADLSWYAPSDRGPVLMRPLPLCADLPDNLIGFRRDFGAVQPPMWHRDRYIERVVPC